jgi:indole-3-glycerol phosphate synthase
MPPGFPQDIQMPPPGEEAPNTWHPEGLLREAVDFKCVEMELMEGTMLERPDHPVQLRMSFYETQPTNRFTKALRRGDGTLAVVAALKRFQPRYDQKKPELVAALNDIGREARVLELAGVDAAFVNTDSMRYGCELAELTDISRRVAKTSADLGLPLARQDLIIHPIQIAEAAVAGAAAVTICAAAAMPDLLELLNAATAMGIEAIVECHTELERDLAIECGATLMYFTNRDRSTNQVHPGTAERLRVDIPAWIVTMGGGELVTARDAWSLLDAGFDAVVFGETLLKSRRAADFIAEIRSEKRTTTDPFQADFTT